MVTAINSETLESGREDFMRGLNESAWTSHRGSILSGDVISRVDLDLLARAYEAEAKDEVLPEMDSATRQAWQLGYKNPRRSPS